MFELSFSIRKGNTTMFDKAINKIKDKAQNFKKQWKDDSEFRQETVLSAGKGFLTVGALIIPVVMYRKGYDDGYDKGYIKGSDQMADWMTGCLNEYEVPMPDRLRNDIAEGKCLPFGMPTK